MNEDFVKSRGIVAWSFRRIRWAALLLAVLMNLAALPVAAVDFSVAAVDFSVSAFGTLGYARSDQPYTYQRFIDRSGTFRRDSLAGLQVDARLADKFGATVQVKVAPDTGNDNRYEGSVSWAFLSYRPTNDWLIRAGKQRIPFYLYSETVDVGVTYDFARLPTEMYSIISSNDFTGLSFSKNWGMENGDLSLTATGAREPPISALDTRQHSADAEVRRSIYEEDVKGGGLVLSYKRNEDTYRIGVHRAVFRRRGTGLRFRRPSLSSRWLPASAIIRLTPRSPAREYRRSPASPLRSSLWGRRLAWLRFPRSKRIRTYLRPQH